MAQIFCKNRFYPQHFYLACGSSGEVEARAERISREAAELSPESFNGESLFFLFALRYCPPYEQDRFRELKRLQEDARSHARFKDEYRGYVVIDVSEWDGHLDEELFAEVTMSFLSDMSDCWKYIFVSVGRELSGGGRKVLERYFKVKKPDAAAFAEFDPCSDLLRTLRDSHDIRFSPQAAELFRRFAPSEAMRAKEVMVSVENDVKAFFGAHATVKKETLADYLTDADGVCYGLISEKERETILRLGKEEPGL